MFAQDTKHADSSLVFNQPLSLDINKARLEHLASLGLPLSESSVLEVGSGAGLLTSFFEDMGCSVLSTEGRMSNIQENIRLHPHRREKVLRRDLNQPGSHDGLGIFDITFCYGTLYHIEQPASCLADLARVTGKILLLETCVFPVDNGSINFVSEEQVAIDQALKGTGCRPARDWVYIQLRKNFKYVYLTKTQPNHHDFPLQWPVSNCQYNARSVFIASHTKLSNPTLHVGIPPIQTRYQG